MLEQKDEQLLIDLTSARGVPGNEEEVREVFKTYAKDYADEIIFDGLGSVIAKHGQDENSPRIFISGHMDEVGLRGARTSTYLANPEIAFALDTGTAGDTPGMTPKEADSVLGKGPQILIFDASMVPHKKLLNFVTDVAEELEIPFQYTVIAGGGTDAGQMHLTRQGIPSLAITVPVRYLHSHTSVIHEDDYLNTVKLVTEVVRRLDRTTVDQILSY
ncbi:hypothetical protein [Enterococcus cecorum]|uniref:hypothetical protein n=1 Tax=Enterococcus cecorum TaxID=44008 RepID=UPI001FAD5EB6|nr:hypothetical protein [Enterococcus cecorum]MCJ0535069.1 hypothetical protein [Enterococcus cecorum]MCJ0555857.1 hypothetical protein [Enterococcus cecorum]